MTEVKKIRAKIEELMTKCEMGGSEYLNGGLHVCITLRDFIDSLHEEVSEDLEEAWRKAYEKEKDEILVVYDHHAGFVAGADWQKEQMMKDVIVQTKFNLKATEEQQSFIESSFLEDTSIIQWQDEGVYLDDFISFDEMAKIVDYLRSNINA